MPKTTSKYVEVEIDTYEEEYNQAQDRAASFLDLLIDRGVVMPLSPFNRSQLLDGVCDVRSVLV